MMAVGTDKLSRARNRICSCSVLTDSMFKLSHFPHSQHKKEKIGIWTAFKNNNTNAILRSRYRSTRVLMLKER